MRFEGSNYRTRVWLNGKLIGGQTGMFLFEAELSGLRKGRNSLVVKVSSLRSNTDLTHWRPASYNGSAPAAGGTSAASCARSTCARSTRSTSSTSRSCGCASCGLAKVEVRALLRNVTREIAT